MVKIEPVSARILANLKARPEYSDDPNAIGRVYSIWVQNPARMRALLGKYGEVIAVIGYSQLWPGVIEIWAVTSPDIEKYPISFTRGLQRFLQELVKNNKLKRIQVTVRQSFSQSIKLFAHLGFEVEATMKSYGPTGENYILMARVF